MLKKLTRTPTDKGSKFEIQKLKENWKTALTNSTKQMNLIIKEKEYKDNTRMNPPPPPPDSKLPHVRKECTCSFGKDSSSVEGTKSDQDYVDVQRKQVELS